MKQFYEGQSKDAANRATDIDWAEQWLHKEMVGSYPENEIFDRIEQFREKVKTNSHPPQFLAEQMLDDHYRMLGD